ncbi:MAG: hypothetical protein HY815_16510 [Candidatus Riflebacteria bacterium]|nr:hypothetical protein [Candidatus Riflebacteria bacterium]
MRGSRRCCPEGVHTLPGVPEASVPEILRTSRLHFVSSYGTRGQTYEKSFPIHVARSEGLVHVTVVHSYCRHSDLELLNRSLCDAGLRLGAVLSPVLALADLARRLSGPGMEPGTAPRLLVDVGATGTLVLLLEGDNVAACRKVFAGAMDWLRSPTDGESDLEPETAAVILEALTSGGPDLVARRLSDRGVPPEEVAALLERIERSWDLLIGAVRQAIPGMTRAQDADEEEDAPPEDPAPPPVPGPIVLCGGGAAIVGFDDRARATLGVPCAVADPVALVARQSRVQLPCSPAAFAACLGARRCSPGSCWRWR